MKKILATIILTFMLASLQFSAHAQHGEKAVGILAGYNSQNNSGIAGLYFQYRCNSWLRLSPDCQILIKHKDRSAFQFDGNAHFLINVFSKANIYPLVGLTYQNWKAYNSGSSNKNRIGGNIGAGFEVMATSTLKVAVEGKYSAVKDFSAGNVFVSIGYVF